MAVGADCRMQIIHQPPFTPHLAPTAGVTAVDGYNICCFSLPSPVFWGWLAARLTQPEKPGDYCCHACSSAQPYPAPSPPQIGNHFFFLHRPLSTRAYACARVCANASIHCIHCIYCVHPRPPRIHSRLERPIICQSLSSLDMRALATVRLANTRRGSRAKWASARFMSLF